MFDAAEVDPFVLERTCESDSLELAQEVFLHATQALLLLAANGYPRAVRSTAARRNAELRRARGDQEAAAQLALEEDTTEEVKEFLLRLVPYFGLPAAVVYPLWKLLRKICLVASIFGHDLQQEAVQAAVLLAAAGLHSAEAAQPRLEKALQALWKRLARGAVRAVPVGTVLGALVDLQGQAGELILAHFRKGSKQQDYSAPLDPEPTLADFLQMLQQTGRQTLEAAAAAASGKEQHVYSTKTDP
ncbi:unnamed protein product [Effrenium voratum]|nr:unnamed protein product [Effrenium voratum]